MPSRFPTAHQNELLKRIAADPRSKKRTQERPVAPVVPPKRFRRTAQRPICWGLDRSLVGYRIEQDDGIGGKATKWVIRGRDGDDDFYIAKFGNKNGRVEVFTELFNNQLGSALGFDMAHSGVARLDDDLYFITRNFRRGEVLVHGSLMIEDLFSARKELDHIAYRAEQSFYSVNFIHEVISAYCGSEAESVFARFIEMLVFDALIGSMDRHAMNWGVLRSQFTAQEPGMQHYRLAPIFDSARALLWDLPEGKLLLLDADPDALESYVLSAGPCIGPHPDHPKVNDCNHFDFFESLLKLYPHQTRSAYRKIPVDVCTVARTLLSRFPFGRAFSSMRKRVILKILQRRVDKLKTIILTEGGANDAFGKTGAAAENAVHGTAAHSAIAI